MLLLSVLGEELKVRDKAKWTVAVYMNGDNNLERAITGGFITQMQELYHDILKGYQRRVLDISLPKIYLDGDFHHELADLGSNSDVNVVALVDRTPGYSENMDNWTETRLYYINQGDYPDNTRGTYWNGDTPEMNMGNQESVVWFIETVQKYFPSEKFYLSMWDHNLSWRDGFLEEDITNNSDTISYGKLYDALYDAKKQSKISPIDVIGYDACISAHIEVLHTWSFLASQYAGSQDYLGWEGVDYTTVIRHIHGNPNTTPESLAVTVARSIMTDPTIGCASAFSIGTSDFDNLVENINDLGKLFLLNLDEIRDKLILIRNNLRQVPNYYNGEVDTTYKDLYHLAKVVYDNFSDYPYIMKTAKNILIFFVNSRSCSYTNENLDSCLNGEGLTIYWVGSEQQPLGEYMNLSFSRNNTNGAPKWAEFLTKF